MTHPPICSASDFQFELILTAPAANVYEALTTQTGLRSWWTTTCDVGTGVGAQTTIRFGSTVKVLRIEALVPPTDIQWRVTQAHLDVPGLTHTSEWTGTTICFQVRPQSETQSRLQLTHIGLTPQVECFELCSAGWRQFLCSLKNYVESGVGAPYVGAVT